MQEIRSQRAKLNISTTLLKQLVTTACGVVIPGIMISAYGSAMYGATTSIAQFLSYISLLEGGIGSVARGALYEPLAKQDHARISSVYQGVKFFFRCVGAVFLLYTIIIATFYYDIANITIFSRKYTFFLVISISLFTFANYMGGFGNMTLLHADQRQYFTNIVITVTNIINTLCIILLVSLDTDLLIVKLISSIIFIVRPILYSSYVKKQYVLTKQPRSRSALEQKWTGIGQHIAYFLHVNTDIILLTLFADLKLVAVYSVYNLITYSIWNIASSFSGGMEAAFGDMLAKGEENALLHSYRYYKSILTIVSLILFGCATVLILPFIKLYTSGVTDANYIQPLFGFILILCEAMNCLALPCSTLPISANRLRQTRIGSYGEAFINITLSLVLIRWNPLLGVAMGTLTATLFKCIYYSIYSSKHILKCNPCNTISIFFASLAVLIVLGGFGMLLFRNLPINNYLIWAAWGVLAFLIIGFFVILFGFVVFPQEVKTMFIACRKRIKNIFRKA